jgi:hypothetical protein
MSGIKALRIIQMGRETTAGTIVAATTVWRGTGTLEDKREVKFPEEDVGYLPTIDRNYVPKLFAALGMDSVEATFEQSPHVFEAAIKAVSAVQDGSGSGYVRTYPFPVTETQALIKTYTLEGGDNQQAEVSEYCYVPDFTLEAKSGEAWTLTPNWEGRQIAKQAFTGSVALPTVEEILFGATKIYIDDVTGTIGSTQKTLTLLGAKLNYKSGLIPKFTGDGQLYFSFVQQARPEATLTLTFEHNATAVAEKDKWIAKTARLIRLLSEGATFTTAGSSYTNKTQIIDVAGKYESFGPLGDQDGNDILEAVLKVSYDPTAAFFGRIINVNTLSALP